FGIGFGQYNEYHFLTAHNSYILAAAETGLPGLFLFCTILYLSTKIPLKVLADFKDDPDAEIARAWAMALLAAMAGVLVGIFFLSFVYKQMLWVYIGLSGALYSAIKRHRPTWDVGVGFWECAGIGVFCSGLVAVLYVYTKLKV